MEEVEGSSPSSSTFEWIDLAGYTLGGLIAGEGSFSITRRPEPFVDGDPRLRFVFSVSLAEHDAHLLCGLRTFLGTGSIRYQPRRRPHWLSQAVFTVGGERAHLRSTIPFCERYLLPGAKRRQFDRWRNALLDYRRQRETKPGQHRSTCRVPGCTGLVRGRGLCRPHYYRETGW